MLCGVFVAFSPMYTFSRGTTCFPSLRSIFKASEFLTTDSINLLSDFSVQSMELRHLTLEQQVERCQSTMVVGHEFQISKCEVVLQTFQDKVIGVCGIFIYGQCKVTC